MKFLSQLFFTDFERLMFIITLFNNKLLITSSVVLGTVILYRFLKHKTVSIARMSKLPSPEGMDEMMTGEQDCLVPKTTDTFTLGKLIGCGSYANVYKAIQKDTRSVIAIKFYKMRKKTSSEICRTAVEMAFVKFLQHPNIIKFILCDIKCRYIYLGIEYSCFGSLQKAIPKDHTAPEGVVQILMKQLISALVYLHSMSIMHGDVKPENIIVIRIDPDPLIKLSDFGLAEIFFNCDEKGKKIGSFLYMAPELHLGFPYDLSTDLYSAGVVMYELLYGRTPFPSQATKDNYIQLLRKRIPIQYPQVITAQLSTTCVNLLQSLLQYDKQKRPSSEELVGHPFLDLKNEYLVNKDNHYIMGCDCLMKSVKLVAEKKFGQAYVEATEAILHLKIYAKTILSDEGMFAYLLQNIHYYSCYLSQIEIRIMIERDYEPINMPMLSERLRCMLSSTPALLTGYDMCLVGEMYINQGKNEEGVRKLKDGLEVLFMNIRQEPLGDRRIRLLKKMKQWVNLLENLGSNAGHVEECVNVEEPDNEAKN
ncbi:unnamed protein product [Phyllotreta striolata]|uniref:Protein kinase domain-containing protein n=1 Tax=Phyllotreta striolata TaxID=444603 RepID=A0A9N9TGK1_PHYSR|nr:unnamed protein product [Phyllotreta striolata]